MSVKEITTKITSKISREAKTGAAYGAWIGGSTAVKLLALKVSGKLEETEMADTSYGKVAKTGAIVAVGAIAVGATTGAIYGGIKKFFKARAEKKEVKSEQAPA
jgi:hypothetical protein